MKKFIAILISLVIIFSFCGCDYYSDETISILLPKPDKDGLVEYQAGLSDKKNAARVELCKDKNKHI